jgi:hypothetical protein
LAVLWLREYQSKGTCKKDVMEQANGQKILGFAADASGKTIAAKLRKQGSQKCS